MSRHQIECSIRLTHADFIMQNHRVHGVSVMPGVTFLDIVYRILLAQGADVRRVALRNVLFSEPVTTREGFERELRVTIDETDSAATPDVPAMLDTPRRFRVESRWLRDGRECAPWRENARGELSEDDDEAWPSALDVERWKARATRRVDMESVYERTRGEEIVHGVPMKCFGTLHWGPDGLLAELSLDDSVADQAVGFHLHPAKMDASTLVAFGQLTDVGAEGFIPFFAEYFRAPRALGTRFHVLVPQPEAPSESGELLRNDYRLFDEAGGFLAEVRGMSCKRIRHPELITRLLAEVDSATLDEEPGEEQDPVGAVTAYLRAKFGGLLGRDPATLPVDAGFYDLGLDSVALLRLSEELAEVAGAALYPTLLFEFGDIQSLARHLVATYPVRIDLLGSAGRAVASLVASGVEATTVEVATARVEATVEVLAARAEVAAVDGMVTARVETMTARAEVAAARVEAKADETAVRGEAVTHVEAATALDAAADVTMCFRDVWVPTPTDTGDARELVVVGASEDLLRGLREHGCRVHVPSGLLPDAVDRGHPTSFVLLTSDPETVWALAAGLVGRRLAERIRILIVTDDPALSAMAATISAEVPAIRCRVVDTDHASPDVILAELADESSEPEIRFVDGVRHVRRWQPTEPGPSSDVGTGTGTRSRTGTGFKHRGAYLITGGAGGVAGLLADHLVGTYQARIGLIGRGPCPDDLKRRIASWERLGGSVCYLQADVTRTDEARDAASAARTLFGTLDGVLHCAGSTADGLFFRKQPAEAAAVWSAKTIGTLNLDTATSADDLDLFVLFSSLSAVTPNPGQADYAFGNAFQYHFARRRAEQADRAGRTLAVAWPLWADGGMRVSDEAASRSRSATGMSPMPTAAAIDILERGLAGTHPGFAVIHGDPDRIPAVLPAAEPQPPATPPPSVQTMPIAVIGMAGRYPGAADLDEFWRNLAEGRDSVTEIPAERWDHAGYFDADKDAVGRTYGRWGGFLDGVDRFDPGFFGISRRDAERMDPQERLFLTTGWQAFEDAGYPPRSLARDTDEAVGVFVGVMWNHYQLFTDGEGGVAPAAMHASIANRVSYCLDLRGPSMAVDTACSSSLTAVHLAVESIRRGESTMALAGGVNVSIHPQKYLQLAEGRFLSTDGRCRSFGEGGDGYVPGEGVGAVLLKPLDRALADGDHVYCVISETALNHTGRTSGFTVPSPAAQGQLVREALAKAGWDPGSVGCLEAHGTGTALGDPIEADGLRQAFSGADVPAGTCALGSVKSNIGHLESAAGIAGLTKVALQLQHAELVPSLHAEKTNPHIDFTGSAFRVQQVREPWRSRDGAPRRAGVSAFGAGGANAHVLVQEAPASAARVPSRNTPTLFVLSARDGSALRAYAQDYLSFLSQDRSADSEAGEWIAAEAGRILGVPADTIDLAEPLADLGFDAAALQELARRLRERWPDAATPTMATSVAAVTAVVQSATAVAEAVDIGDLAYTLQVGRTHMASRFAAVVTDLNEVRRALQAYLDGDPPEPAPSSPRLGARECVAAFRAGRLADVAASWLAGAEVDWTACRRGDRGVRRVKLPTYPFQEEPCWIGRWKGTMRPSEPVRTSVVPEPVEPIEPLGPIRPLEPPEPFANSDALEMRVLEPGIALLTMRDRAGNNMFTDTMTRGLQSAFAEIAGREDVKAVVITGTADVFSMGATPEALEVLASGGSRFTDVPFIYEGMLRCDRPVIAAIQGHASGGGLAFGLYADIVVMARDGVYSANFMKYGFTPGMGATYILEQRLGRAVAAEMFYTSRPFSGEELERRGANISFAAQADVLPAALTAARSITEKSAHAVRVLKKDLADRVLAQLPEVIARESAMHDKVFSAESANRIREHFTKVNGYRESVPVAEPAPARVPEQPPSRESAAAPGPVERRGVPDRDAVTRTVVGVLCASLYLEPSEIDEAMAFSEMGLDSIGAVELVRELNREFALDIDSVAVYDHPTIPRLVAYVGELTSRDRELYVQATAQPDLQSEPEPESESELESEPERGREPVSVSAPEPELISVPGPAAGKISLRPLAKTPRPVPAEKSRRTVTEQILDTPNPGSATRDTSNDIAVIGMSGRFPEAPDLESFWTGLLAGRDSVREVPADRWDVGVHFDPDRKAPGRTYSKWAALLSDVDAFDAAFFRISPLEAEAMDPQQRIFLQTAWAGIEDAGYAVGGGGKRRWGVFVGCAAGDYSDLLRQADENESAHAFLGNSGSVLAARIAYHLDLTGPTMAVDTACSSSLAAVHLACQSIRAGECDAAVAGGVALMLTPRMHVLTSKTGMLSPTGRSAPFDASADGIVLGEACGAVVLKRLDRALADGDTVHGVILGSGVNGDGRTNGLTAPSAASQSELIGNVLRQAGLTAADLTYVEAHGTGTPLGDPIEVKALDLALGTAAGAAGSCGIGSVKSNIGHTTTAAGVVGLLKVLLALRHRTLPPTINFTTANPEIDFSRGRLRPIVAAEQWRAGASGRLIGAVSSFGFSGTNAHVLVAEAPRRPDPAPDGDSVAVLLSAPTDRALGRIKARLAERLAEPEDRPSLVDVAYTLAVGRSHFAVRDAVVVRDHDELLRWLAGESGGFPGADAEPARQVADYLSGREVDRERRSQDCSGRRVSLPTYPFAQDRHWVSAPTSTVPEPRPASGTVPRRIDPGDWLVADHVVGGTPLLPGVAAFELVAESAGADVRVAPFRVSSVQWQRPFEVRAARTVLVTATSRGHEVSGDDGLCCSRARVGAAGPDLLDERLDVDAIAWRCPDRRTGADVYRDFAASGIEYGPSFQVVDEVRFGPDEALAVLRMPIARAGEAARRPLHPTLLDGALQTIAVLVGATDSRPHVPFALASADFLAPVPEAGYSHVTRDGTSSFTVRILDGAGRVCVRFTGLALRAIGASAKSTAEAAIGVSAKSPAAGMIFIPRLRAAAAPVARGRVPQRVAVLYGPGSADLARAVVAVHETAGDEAVAVSWELDAPNTPDVVYFLANALSPVESDDGRTAVSALLRTTKTLLTRRELTIKAVVAGTVGDDTAELRPAAAGVQGLLGSVAAERPRWTVGCVDIGTKAWDPSELAGILMNEPCAERLIVLCDGRRMTRVLRPLSASREQGPEPFRQEGVYLIVGGTGGIGTVLARHLAEAAKARLVLVGRRSVSSKITEQLAELERLGGRAIYVQADVCDAPALRRVVDRTHREFGALHGAFHAALALRDSSIANLDEAALSATMAAKTTGAVAFGETLKDEALDLLVFFSSAVAFTDAAGQGNYAAASTFEDCYALSLRSRCGFPVSVVDWGYWGSVGAVANERYADVFDALDVGSIEPREGMAALTELLRAGTPQALVVKAGPAGLARLGVETADPREGGDPVASARAAFAELERLAPELLRPVIGVTGPATVGALRARLAVVPSMERLFDALIDMLRRAGAIRTSGDVLESARPAANPMTSAEVIRRHPSLAAHVELLERCVKALPRVLDGSVRATEVLFPHGSAELVEKVYHGQPASDFYHRLMADAVREAVVRIHRESGRTVRIVEVGAGTGAGSALALAACAASGAPVEYSYTDVSTAFLNRGEDAFAGRYPFLRFQLLDIERDPGSQGFDEHGYDLVLATNVLHATSRMARTLDNVRRLIRPGGALLVNEVTAASDFLTLTFGLTPGWWKFADPETRLAGAPLISPARWRSLLADGGFGAIRISGFTDTAPDELEQCLIVATAMSASASPAAAPTAPAVRDYVRRIFAEILRFKEQDLDDRVTFENYGVDSLVSLDIISRFESDLGPLTATLLFDHMTIDQLAVHFLAERPGELAAMLTPSSLAATAAAVPAPAPTPPSEPEVVEGMTPREQAALPPAPVATTADREDTDAIAVIGVSGRYPGAPTVDAFWQLLAEGRTGVTEIPADRWDWRTHFDADPSRPQRTYSRWGGFIEGVDQFDPGFFGILPREAENIDPQERLFLETAWNLLEETGYLGEHTREPETGVFVGTMYGSYGQLGAAQWANGQLTGAHSAYWSIANRASYILDLHGPSFAVDSACSSSLLAVHLACESIRRGECRAAIAGGVNVILHPAHFVALSSMNMLSADGRCKTFDASADGFVPGEGVGAVLLKPLRRAVADGDRIWGVIRAGQANAGGKTGGYTVPNPHAQTAAIGVALERAGIDPGTIGYVEAHGTGTGLGDPIEVSALGRALGAVGRDGLRCAIGSVKANVGHLEGAAGIAGLTKVLLQLRHGKLAPCVNLDVLNPKIDLDPERFTLPRELSPWPVAGGVPRRAGISSFGAGGANVHLVLEEYQGAVVDAGADPAVARPGEQHAFILSARSRGRLAVYARQVAEFLDGTDVSLAELCYTSQVGRREMAERVVVLADSTVQLGGRLAAFAETGGRGDAPDGVLSGTVGRSSAADEAVANAGFVRELVEDRRLDALARMWVTGAPIDWRPLWIGRVPQRVAFPTYPFERKRYWLSPTEPVPAGADASAVLVPMLDSVPDVAAETVCRFRRIEWAPMPPRASGWHPKSVLLVTSGNSGRLAASFERLGAKCVIATPAEGDRFVKDVGAGYRFDPTIDDHCDRLVTALADRGLLPDAVVYEQRAENEIGTGSGTGTGFEHIVYPIIRLATGIMSRRAGVPLRVALLSSAPDPIGAAASAALRTLALEHTRMSGVAVQTDRTDGWEGRVVADLASDDADVRYRDGMREVKLLEEFTPPASADLVRSGGTYLITGGAGALGLHFAEFLAARAPVTVVLAGRSKPGPEASARMAALAGNGSSVVFHRADVTSVRDMAGLVSVHGPIHGVIHAAGIARDAWAARKTRADMAAVVAPKASGAAVLDEATRDLPLDFFVLFSSVAGETGNPGQVDYAAANAFLHGFAQQREVRRLRGERSGRTVAIGWPLWEDGGMAVDAATRELFARKWGMAPMRTAVGIEAFGRILASSESVVLAVEEMARREGATSQGSKAVPAIVSATAPSADRLRESAEAVLRAMASGFLLVDESEIVLTDDLLDTGFDSISLTELINKVNERYRLDLLPTVLFECADLAAFARYLVENHAAEIAATVQDLEAVASVPVALVPVAVAVAVAVAVPAPVAPLVASTSADPALQEEPSAVAEPVAADVRDDVAIVGMAAVLPGSPDLDTFWRHLLAGDDLVGPAPADRLELHAHPDTDAVRGGFVEGIADFDAPMFRISPAEAALMDPQQRMFLQAVWRAVQDAGHRPEELAGTETGLFVGVSTTDYADLLRQHDVAMEAHAASGIAHSILANRVSHVLGLEGPSEAVDTACSSSLVALHRAVTSIASGECSSAIVGGVNALLSPGLFTAFTASGMLSPDAACKTFDARADGYVRGEGVGAVLLKPLSAARADGDHVYAVVRGTAVNHGGRSASLTAPNPESQAKVLIKAYRTAGVDPTTVTAVEAHGTGTGLGDPVEVEGLKKAFAQLYADHARPAPTRPHIALGSVKTNIGHLEAAAGMAGLIKTLLAMKHGVLPPTIHYREPNPHLRLDGTPFFVNDTARPWPGVEDETGRTVRRAGVSSFGFGGTNAHVVLEAVVDELRHVGGHSGAGRDRSPVVSDEGRSRRQTPDSGAEPRLLMLSAATDELVAEYARSLARFLSDRPDADLASVAFTLHAGRPRLTSRLAIIAENGDQAIRLLADAGRGEDAAALVFRGRAAKGGAEVGFLGESLGVVAAQWVAGAAIAIERLWPGDKPRRVSLPPTPLARRAHWFDDRAARPRTVTEMPEPPATIRTAVSDLPATTRTAAPDSVATARPAPIRTAVLPPPQRAKVTLAAPSGRAASAAEQAPPLVAAPSPAPRAPISAGDQVTPLAAAPSPDPRDPISRGTAVAAIGDLPAAVRTHVAAILGLDPEEVAGDASFADLGLDSIFRMDLARRLNADFVLELQAAELYEYDTVALLTAHVQSVMQVPALAQAEVTANVGSTPQVPATAQAEATANVEAIVHGPATAPAESAEPVPHAVPEAETHTGLPDLLKQYIEAVLDRPVASSSTFTDNGFTSFDMLRVVSALERRFGALRKTLLFDLPTAAELAAHLGATYGEAKAADLLSAGLADDLRAPDSGPIRLDAPLPPPSDGPQPLIVRKRKLAGRPDVVALLANIDDRHAKEGGLAGRDIAPLAFIGSGRTAYFNFSRRDGDLFAWSYAGSEEDFPVLAAEWLAYAARHGFRPGFLSLLPLADAAGVALTATPFGAVQRLENLAGFSIAGGKMTRLRYMINRFEKTGNCTTDEYRPGTDPVVDREITDMIGRWAERKQMVNPYVAVVREELARGVIGPRHRMFLTRRDGELMNVVIVTRIPSENAYLLDLEFYPKKAPTGGLESAIVRILERLRDEGVAMFSFGASFGVQVSDSDNAAPDIADGLAELRSVGVFGEGNYQFKNKFRPENLPIYLCQRADGHRTAVADVILMIADPDIDADVPGMLGDARDARDVLVGRTAPRSPAPASTSASSLTPAAVSLPAPASAPSLASVPSSVTAPTSAPSRQPLPLPAPTPPPAPPGPPPATLAVHTRQLIDAGHNPLSLPHSEIETDLVTDSWAELDLPAIAARTARLQERSNQATGPLDFPIPDWLPFDLVLPTPSGRAAESLLCRTWPGPRGLVIHNGLFPTWTLSLLDTGFHLDRTAATGSAPRFPGDLDLPALRAQLAAGNGGTAFVALELSGNAGGGHPISLANLRAVREAAAVHGVPIVLDATRLLENAVFIADRDEERRGADPWDVARELLSLADAATFSLSKDFGVTFGGLVASRLPALTDRLNEHVAMRGREVGLASRRLLAAALADREGVSDLVTGRIAAVAELWGGLSDAGVPLAGPAGAHCVLLDVDRMPAFRQSQHAVESCLAWLYQGTGVRGAPHLGSARADGERRRLIRLAVPQGVPVQRMREVAQRIAELWQAPGDVPDLIPVGAPTSGPTPVHARFHPAASLPDDIEEAMREGHRPQDENALVLAEATAHGTAVERRILPAPGGGEVEVFTAGDGPALLLMHPFNIGAGVFARQYARLADRFRLITVHHPGVGATTTRADLTLDGLAALYRDVLDALGVAGPVHVAGASFGGLVAQSFALAYPADTATLTLIGSSFKVGNRNGEVNRLSVVAKEDFDRVVHEGGSTRVAAERADLERLLLRCESMDPQTGLSYLDVFASQATLLARLPDIAVPTLVVQGRCDTVIPMKTAHLLHGAIPDSEYVELADAGHFPCLSHPDEVHAVLVPFLASHTVDPHTVDPHTVEAAWRP